MTTALADEPAKVRCRICKIPAVEVGGVALTRGTAAEWKHEWGTMPVRERPSCPKMWGPLSPDDIEGIED